MKRGGHVAGRRCSRCLCDSVQIHPTLKRRMCTKRKRDESLGCTKLSSTAKNPPAAGQTPRHERMNHRERISTRVLFFHDNNKKKRLWGKKKKSHGSFFLHYSSDSPVRSPFLRDREKLLPAVTEKKPLALQPTQESHPFAAFILPKMSESHPLNLPAARKYPPKQDI